MALGQQLLSQLRSQGRNPYLIPVGGSNALGTWGYLEAVEELRQQQQALAAMYCKAANMSSTSTDNEVEAVEGGSPFFSDIVVVGNH
jgi:1-aminocyclopropane-1-carboxylate deaminase/D-cysteine desulfhydrase-like pyridoxal-dependent ACC family enzyme